MSEENEQVVVVRPSSANTVGCILIFVLLVGGVTSCLWWPVAEAYFEGVAKDLRERE
jgi:hypothetical protein